MRSTDVSLPLTETRDLRGGQPCWVPGGHLPASDPLPEGQVDVAIVGAGVMGCMLAERLARQSRKIALLDRRPPGQGSTAASTALVMWAADIPLSHLSDRLGENEAARRWRRVRDAQARLGKRIDAMRIDCGKAARPELYLAGGLLDDDALRLECEARMRAGLPSRYLCAEAVSERFGIAPRAALVSDGSFEVDPVRLTLGLLAEARRHGARCCFPADVVRLEAQTGGCTKLVLGDGQALVAKEIVFASGYERPSWFLPPAFSVISSYAVATAPAHEPLWRESAMIWEASSPYLYARGTPDGRIIAGGEDEAFDDAQHRDALIGAKAGTIAAKLEGLAGSQPIAIDCAWAAVFGWSPDGLPAHGRVANYENCWVAAGFGGNGVTFATLGAELIAAAMSGTPDPDASCFDPYRFEA